MSTHATPPETTRLEIRIPVEVKRMIERAASACHLTMSAFILQTMKQAAEDVMARDRVTVIPPDFYEAMMAALENPAESDESLAEAARRRREIVRKK
ncbi:DUF1778 domain-containing protein [Streptomyces alkaliphilus]|uniref:type II toxin-antitoxin system TacA family antitoxin n=1 Tax=Streptomyces alkaliphilus TaxID=1472722 RepID=UPI001180E601|nr:DUF1778 domain-containing protein [Streptomyces alkaliphilus]MQS07947.1 DUF1778 domain-containing protein [Streptomyces alkaliphilus]